MKRNLEEVMRETPRSIRATRIERVETRHLQLHLVLSGGWEFFCDRAVDYSIRPPHPGILLGGPAVALHDHHHLLESDHLQLEPGGDGEVFNPPLVLKLLEIDQSWVIAQSFEVDRTGDYPW